MLASKRKQLTKTEKEKKGSNAGLMGQRDGVRHRGGKVNYIEGIIDREVLLRFVAKGNGNGIRKLTKFNMSSNAVQMGGRS